MILYLDTSSVVAIYLEEPGRYEILIELLDQTDLVVTSVITYAEARAAFALARRSPSRRPQLAPANHEAAVTDLNRDWPTFVRLPINEALVQIAGENAETYSIRGYDSIHLTSALRFSRTVPDGSLFSTWDRTLALAAVAAGLTLAHEVAT